jgi:ankyrin repeat protein
VSLDAAVDAIRSGDVALLERLCIEDPALATSRIGPRTLLHVATDWPGHFPGVAATVRALVAAGADVNARFDGPAHAETPLHWAASSDDVEALDALLDAGADLEADGGVIGGGTPLADATAFGQWRAARRLVERGARTTPFDAAALGLVDRLDEVPPDEVNAAFWAACHGGQRAAAELVLERGAELEWVGWDDLTPLGAALRSEASDVVEWLRARGAG